MRGRSYLVPLFGKEGLGEILWILIFKKSPRTPLCQRGGILTVNLWAGYYRRVCRHSPSVRVLISAICLLSLSACGYTVHGRANLPFRSVSLGKIVNKTFEPKLEDRMQVALAEELLKNGFSLENNADHKIEGVIKTYELRVLSEKGGVADQYEVVINGDFRLLDSSGASKPLRGGGIFIVSFKSAGTLPEVMAQKDRATARALRDLSSEIVASMIY